MGKASPRIAEDNEDEWKPGLQISLASPETISTKPCQSIRLGDLLACENGYLHL